MPCCKICHSVYGTVQTLLGGCCKILHQVAAFAKKNTVFLSISKDTLGCGAQCDPPVTKKKLVIYIGFITVSKFAGCEL